MSTLHELMRRNVAVQPPNGNGHAPLPPEDPLSAGLRQQQAEAVAQARMAQMARQQKLAEAAAEADALKIENDLEDEKERQRERRRERMMAAQPPPQGNEMMAQVMGMFLEMQKEAQARLAEVEAKQAEAVRSEVGALRDLMRSILEKPQPSAVDAVKDAIAFMQTIQELAPKPPPVPAAAPSSNIEDTIRLRQWEAEMDMKRAAFQRDLARDDDERKQWEAELEFKQRRAAYFGQMLTEAFPKLTEAITERVAAGAANGAAKALAGPAAAIPWTCPDCQATNTAPEGVSEAACAGCGHHFGLTLDAPDQLPAQPAAEEAWAD
jgi:hypothetical protein